jgi:hypothetical protein
MARQDVPAGESRFSSWLSLATLSFGANHCEVCRAPLSAATVSGRSTTCEIRLKQISQAFRFIDLVLQAREFVIAAAGHSWCERFEIHKPPRSK